MKPAYQDIPEELRALPNWVCWRLEKRVNKRGEVHSTKILYNAKSGKRARSNDPSTWSSFPEAMAALEAGGYDGPGFAFTPPFIGADFDGCRVNGKNEEWAEKIIRELNSYTELSYSTDGVHVIVKGSLPDGRRQKDFGDREHHGVGLYDTGRYFVMTGNCIGGNGIIRECSAELHRIHAELFPPELKKAKAESIPLSVSDVSDDDLIVRAKAANDGGKFSRLWDGNWKSDYASQSEGDLGLCRKLSFWTSRDAACIDRLFRRSGLMRDKWNRADYRDATITKAIEQTTETWKSKPKPYTAVVDLSQLEPSLELLNGLDIFGGRIRFLAFRWRGPMIIGTPERGQEIIWYSIADLTSFYKSQAILADATAVLIATPPKSKIRAAWEPAVQLILQLANRDKELSEPPLQDEFREMLRGVWGRAGEPEAVDGNGRRADELFVDLLQKCTFHARDPHAEPPACCAWMAEGFAWVHLPSLLDFLSCPVAKSKHFDWSDARKALMLLGFTYIKDCHRSIVTKDGQTKEGKASVWRGSKNLLRS